MITNDDVIEQIDSDYFARFIKSCCDIDIFRTGCRNAAWMVVGTNDRSSGTFYSFAENFTGMDDAGIQAPNKYGLFMEHLIFYVEKKTDKMLLL